MFFANSNVVVTIMGSKIFYGANISAVLLKIASSKSTPPFFLANSVIQINPKYVTMTESQFVRFKNAGKRHASKAPGKMAGSENRTRADRTQSGNLNKWDVGYYRDLIGRHGPWGDGSFTNRDHMLANSSNQQQFNNGTWTGPETTSNQVKNAGIAITVSGKHHREHSATYGGRTKQDSPLPSVNRTEYGALEPTAAFKFEMDAMLSGKATITLQKLKNTLRIEMVGGYAYMYKFSVTNGQINATVAQDQALIDWLKKAVNNDPKHLNSTSMCTIL